MENILAYLTNSTNILTIGYNLGGDNGSVDYPTHHRGISKH